MAFWDLRRILKELLPSPAMVEQAEVLRIQTQMEEIRRPLWAISAVIFDAYLRAMALKEQELDDWMADVGAAMVDLEDLLASIINRQEERAVESGRSSSRSSSLLLPARLAFRVVILRKLKKMGRILNGLVERGYAFDLWKEPMDSMDPLRDGYSAVLKDEVKESRRAEYEEIMEHLQQQQRQRKEVEEIMHLQRQQRQRKEVEMDSTEEDHSSDDIVEMERHSGMKDEEYSSVEMDAPFRIVIEGDEGMGKRTLARMIYHDEWVRQHFHHRFWVDASNLHYDDVAGLGREIGRSMVGHGNYSEGSSLQEMWVFVDRQLAGRRYLLILAAYHWSYMYSDFHSKRREKWNELKDILLRVGGPGSTIIATTTYSYTVPGEFRLKLESIPYEDWRGILMRWAFAYDRPDQDKHKEEEDMAREMAMKIYERHYGSYWLYYLNPFDAKMMGSLLRYIEISKWHSDLEKIVNHENKNLIELYLGDQKYNSIVLHRSLFMDDDDSDYDDSDNDIFILEDFMHLMIANGLLPLWSDKDVRVDYMSTIMLFYKYRYGGKYKSKDIQNQYYFTVNLGKDSPVISKQCRRLCLLFSSKTSTISFSILPSFERNKLRTLIFRCSREYVILKDPKYKIPAIPEETFAALPHLHTLYLQDSTIQHLLSAIGRLRNLRYLNLSYTDIHKFSRSLCNLQNLHILNLAHCQNLEKLSGQIHRLGRLQILKLAYCEKLQMLPATITNLANLQELDLEGCPWLVQLPQGFTNLKRLVELNMYNCVSLTQMPREIGALTNLLRLSGYHANDKYGSALAELQNLVNLKELRVEKLEQVRRSEEIITYLGLQNKTNLSYLTLHWQWDMDLDFQEGVDLEASSQQELEPLVEDLKLSKVGARERTEASIEQQMWHLEDLQPYLPNLKKLEIISYMGNTWPSWMLDSSPFESLIEIKLINLKRYQTIPPLLELKDFDIVEISGMDLIDMKREVHIRQKFTLSEMHKLESLWIDFQSSLQGELNIIHCPKLRKINLNFSHGKLKLWLNNNSLFTFEYTDWKKFLWELEIVGWQELKFLPKDMKFFYYLIKLTIIGCNNLISLPDWMGEEELYQFKSLEICNCPALVSIPAIPKWLEQMTIQGCPKLQLLPDLPSSLQEPSNHKERIKIEGCPKLQLPLRFKDHQEYREKVEVDNNLPSIVEYQEEEVKYQEEEVKHQEEEAEEEEEEEALLSD